MKNDTARNWEDILQNAIKIARNAGAILRQGWGRVDHIEFKGEVDLLTVYDRRAEEIIISGLTDLYPDHHIYSEEKGDIGPAGSDFSWSIDPLDGTTNFAHGFPSFAVSIGLFYRTNRVVGVIYNPVMDELFAAAENLGAYLNGVRMQVSATNLLDRALLATGFAYNRRTAEDNNVGNLSRFIRRCQGVRRAGSAALDLAYVACGRLDGFWEMGLHPWDVAAGTLIVRQAGGQVTDFTGGHDDHPSGKRIVASNGLIHDEMLSILNRNDVDDLSE
ncbi:MAG: inositol monophosphatase [Anaerolineales bacterium]|nr:inositol monophosphatase [Anaerolineales bacterium]